MKRWPISVCLGLCLVARAAQAAGPAPAERDPTLPPPGLRPAVRSGDASAAPAAPELTPRHMMVIDGRRYLIVGGRRHAVGDTLGNARIEGLDDSSVWLREGGLLRQVSLFRGVAKRAVPAAASASAPPASSNSPNR